MTKSFLANEAILVEGRKYEFNSIVSYAMEKNECPIDALAWVEHAKVKWPHAGHVSHWLSPSLVCLSLVPSEQKVVRGVVDFGELVQFEGRFFRIEKANNDNIDMVDCGPVSRLYDI
tara:strand:+ start:2367 stop:2717 length:351 start_codon:yes stop_codon:yes gene_type:complete